MALSANGNLREALVDLFGQEFSYSTGHLATILNGCLFAPSLLTFWFVNGVVDFSTAIAIGAVPSPAGLQMRLIAYLLVVPTFLLTRISVHLLHPEHRDPMFAGTYPNRKLLSLDWFSMGILATGLSLAVQDFGPWGAMNGIMLVGVFIAPRVLPTGQDWPVKLVALLLGGLTFGYANYGGAFSVRPQPTATLGPLATFALTDAMTTSLVRLANSLLFGPLIVGGLGLAMNRILTRPELTDIPLLSQAFPRRDPDRVVLTSAAVGTTFYLLVITISTGQLIVFR